MSDQQPPTPYQQPGAPAAPYQPPAAPYQPPAAPYQPPAAPYQPPAYQPPAYQPPAYQPPAYQPPPVSYAPPSLFGPQPYAFGAPQARSIPQWHEYLKIQLSAGRATAQLLSEMTATGVPAPQAYALVQAALGSLKQRAFLAMGIGAAVLIFFLLVTAGSMTTMESGGVAIIWVGPAALGVVGIIYGFYLLSRLPSL